MAAKRQELAELPTREQGKPLVQALAEVDCAASFGASASRHMASRRRNAPGMGTSDRTVSDVCPRGNGYELSPGSRPKTPKQANGLWRYPLAIPLGGTGRRPLGIRWPEPRAGFFVKCGMNSEMLANRGIMKAWVLAAGLGLAVAAGSGCGRTVTMAPPPDKTEVVTTAPGPDYVWVGGFWGWSWGHYSWTRGRWERPEHPHQHWVQPRWERRDDHFVFVEGYWH